MGSLDNLIYNFALERPLCLLFCILSVTIALINLVTAKGIELKKTIFSF